MIRLIGVADITSSVPVELDAVSDKANSPLTIVYAGEH
jgi:hypothetical protein